MLESVWWTLLNDKEYGFVGVTALQYPTLFSFFFFFDAYDFIMGLGIGNGIATLFFLLMVFIFL